MKRWRGEREGLGKRGSTTFLFSALPGDLKTPPNRSFGLFGAFGQSGRARLRGVLRLLVAEARGGLSSRALLRPGAAAGLRDADAAAILWGGLKLRKRLLHLVVSAAATTFPARVRRRRGLRLRCSRHPAGVRSSGNLLSTRSTGVGGRGGGPASPPSCSQPTHPLPPVAAGRNPGPAASQGPRSGRPNRAAQTPEPLLSRAVLWPAPATQRAGVGAGRGRGHRGTLSQWGRGARLRGCGWTAPRGGASGSSSPPKGATATPREYLDAPARCGVDGPPGELNDPGQCLASAAGEGEGEGGAQSQVLGTQASPFSGQDYPVSPRRIYFGQKRIEAMVVGRSRLCEIFACI